MRVPQFNVEAMTRWQLLVTLLERLQALRMEGIGYESARTLERRVAVCEDLLGELIARERQEKLFR